MWLIFFKDRVINRTAFKKNVEKRWMDFMKGKLMN